MKKLVSLVMLLSIAVCMVVTPALAEPETIQIAYCAPDQNDTQMIFNKCIAAYIDELNAASTDFQIEYSMYNANFDLQTQIVQIESLITKGVDVMFFFACDTEGARSAIQQAMDAGIIVIDAVGTLDYQGFVDCVFVGTGEEQFADMLDEWIQTNYDETGEVLKAGVIYGLLSQTPQLPRGDRRIEYAEAHPEQVEIVATGAGDWNTQTAMSLTEDWLIAHPEMNTIFCANTDMAIGVAQALKAGGVNLDEFILTTVDLTETALGLLEAGEVDVICGCDLYDQAVRMVDLALEIYNGEYTDDICYLERMWCITEDNVDEYREYSAGWNAEIANY